MGVIDMKETTHDYQNCVAGNYYSTDMTGTYASWEEFKSSHYGFCSEGFDDRYNFVFRYDIHKSKKEDYILELCMMLQRKGIYTNLWIENINQETLDTEVEPWLKERSQYLKELWKEVL